METTSDRRKKKLEHLSFASDRRYGIELELNAFDGKNRPDPGKKPEGIDYIANLVTNASEEACDIRDYEHTVNNNRWVVKPDSSCGLEVCTPIYKGWAGIKKVAKVVDAFRVDPKIKADHRCSVHAHIEVSDLSKEQLASVIVHWIKIEPLIMDAMPTERKRNRYCQFMGMTSLFQHDSVYSAGDIIKKVGNVKYYTMNSNQMCQNNRPTIEFRTIEGAGCRDPYLIKNWIRFLIHFVEMASKRPMPSKYKEGDSWSSFCWLDTEDAMRLLGFSDNPQQYELSKGLQQTRNWFLARLNRYMSQDTEYGPRYYAYRELQDILKRFKDRGEEITFEKHLSPSDKDMEDALYCESTKF